ncbi:MAG TPA: hypothetical protein VJU82_03995, partial [Acidobacteriaceae bacterium]|nr:hypothetical protein [Acidobacteriaceae bacterium]
MATIAVPLEPESRSVPIASPALLHSRPFRNSLITALALLALAVEGYHPFAEDGGLYAAGVERLLDPTLFPHWSSFVLAPMRVSIFAPVIAALVRISHLSIPAVLLLVQLGSIWTTLYAAYGIAECCWQSLRARTGAVVLLACWIGLPVAGSSLQIMDPYVTARSFSTPCILLGLLCVLRLTTEPRRKRVLWLLLCAVSLTLGFAMHPLMAGYGIAATCLLACLRSKRRSIQFGGTISCCVAAICLAAVLQHEVAPEPAAYVRAALTRTYWFPQEWTWYELAGLLAPLAILAACLKQERLRYAGGNDGLSHRMSCRVALAAMATVLGATAILVAALFARPDSVTHLVARLQPLRAFQTVYVVMILMLGALLAEYLLEQRVWRWVAAVLLLSSPVFLAERAAFPSSAHIQVSEAGDGNLWIQSFAWVRTHTPKDALFALDPDYIHAPGEDGH